MGKMTAQQAAYNLLVELKRPTSSRELARFMLERGMVQSNAQDPIFSFGSTIEKNIRDDVYNEPRLVYVYVNGERLIGLPGWSDGSAKFGPSRDDGSSQQSEKREFIKMEICIPLEMKNKLQLARAIGFGATDDDVVRRLLEAGLAASSNDMLGLIEKFKRELSL
jgi:hypothetical protein